MFNNFYIAKTLLRCQIAKHQQKVRLGTVQFPNAEKLTQTFPTPQFAETPLDFASLRVVYEIQYSSQAELVIRKECADITKRSALSATVDLLTALRSAIIPKDGLPLLTSLTNTETRRVRPR